jgi:hypothetical protein
MYLPASDLTALGIVSVLPDITCPGLILTAVDLDQFTVGGGNPLALQNKVITLPCITVQFLGEVVINDGSKDKIMTKLYNKIQLHVTHF